MYSVQCHHMYRGVSMGAHVCVSRLCGYHMLDQQQQQHPAHTAGSPEKPNTALALSSHRASSSRLWTLSSVANLAQSTFRICVVLYNPF